MDVLRKNPVMFMLIYTIPGQKHLCYSGVYFYKFYHEGANIHWSNDQITPSMSQIQCVYVFLVQYHTPLSNTFIKNPNP